MTIPEFVRIAVGSGNRVKVGAVRAVVHRLQPDAEVSGIEVPSGVPDQPWGDDETIRGATTRARGALAAVTGATLGVGIEGGCVRLPDGSVHTCAWAVGVDRAGIVSIGGSLVMPLPPPVVARLEAGDELGHAMDALTGLNDVKRGAGAVGILTGGLVDRQGAYETLVAYALSRWITPDYWA
jgi:inosine/xanthosine triphosphatase